MIVGGGGLLTMMVNGAEPVPAGVALSVAVTVNWNVAFLVGVPLSVPLFASMSPSGRAPAVIAQVKPGDPPLATLKV